MPPIEVGASSATSAITRLARNAGSDTASSVNNASATATQAATQSSSVQSSAATSSVQTSEALSAGTTPVDTDRVSEIRKAIQSGDYPLVPAKIGDAMIAAGMFLRSSN